MCACGEEEREEEGSKEVGRKWGSEDFEVAGKVFYFSLAPSGFGFSFNIRFQVR